MDRAVYTYLPIHLPNYAHGVRMYVYVWLHTALD